MLKDGNLILHGSDFDDSTTISDIPNEPTLVKKPKLKSIIVKVGSSFATDLEAPQCSVQFFLLRYSLSSLNLSQGFFCSLSLCDIDFELEVPTFLADTKVLAHLLCIMPPRWTILTVRIPWSKS